jgi:hypothetical protein
MVAKGALSTVKFKFGRQIGSSALIGDAWNDFVDILSAITAMTALGLTLYDPIRFVAADHCGGFAVRLIVIFTGLRVAKDTIITSVRRSGCTQPLQMPLRSFRIASGTRGWMVRPASSQVAAR